MCRTRTPPDKIIPCSRCGEPANPDDGSEHNWPLYGHIEVGFPAQAFAHLGGCRHIGYDEHFAFWNEGHPAATKIAAQDVIFEWGNGYRYNSTDRYRLCYECQKGLLRMLGNFFGIDKRIAELREELSHRPEFGASGWPRLEPR